MFGLGACFTWELIQVSVKSFDVSGNFFIIGMSDHLVLCVDHFTTPERSQSLEKADSAKPAGEGSSSHTADPATSAVEVEDIQVISTCEEEEPLIQTVECRICQEEDSIKNLETPCACSGSLKVCAFWGHFSYFIFLRYDISLFVVLKQPDCFFKIYRSPCHIASWLLLCFQSW